MARLSLPVLLSAALAWSVLCSWGAQAEDTELKTLLEKIAVNNEVLACVSNSALITPSGDYGMLKLWLDGVKHAGVKNYLVIAIDDQVEWEQGVHLAVGAPAQACSPCGPACAQQCSKGTGGQSLRGHQSWHVTRGGGGQVAETMKKLGVPYWRKDPKATADKARSNHGISAMKFQLIKEFLSLGYHLLLSDVDILTLKDPFKKLYRDSDIEAMSDGFDEGTAYGWDDVFDDPKMGWSRWAHSFHIFTLNSGLFYTRANERTIKLMDRITDRLNKEKAWDQAVFNEMVFKPSSPGYTSAGVSARIMDIHEFTNSKTLFRTMRYEKQYERHTPTMIHVNYHPDKFERMQAIWQRYVEGNMHALDRFPVGSCHNAPNC